MSDGLELDLIRFRKIKKFDRFCIVCYREVYIVILIRVERKRGLYLVVDRRFLK